MERSDRYTLTIYVAARGTPMVDPDQPTRSRGTSRTGHMYLETAHGDDRRSAGWQPEDPIPGGGYLGGTSDDDVRSYVSPYYARTMEITQDQFEKIREYSEAPVEHGMGARYNSFYNSCTDYAWGALNHSGLHAKTLGVEFDNFEGIIQPTKNIPAIQSIEAPFPDSPLNKEDHNPMPKQTFEQWLYTSNDRALGEQVSKGVATLDAKHGRTPDEASERMCGSLFCLAKENGLSRVDHVLLSGPNAEGHTGTNVFVVQGEPSDPAHLRASMPTATAAQTPVHESMAQAERLTQTQQQVAQQQDHAQVQEQQDAAVRMG
ncbi:hypothetical protein ICJ04_02055 [Stenotrophomonas sp. 169]|uniref:XVIPCD domain-containing protein n=1 Tax=Stenotrophomonas sp. 169 TaxID=2770322 RepID=UPI0016625BFB|nr:XVIPCD domain-containing protein [Stenotrophomonas sp. 169]QNR97727.1 hypothetical protein ICJ04_02055 [Stenotrophomonas sp. 169]